MSPAVQELPTAYKLPSHVIANPVRTLGVAISCRNHRLLISSFVCIARRLRGRRGDACERRLWRRKRARRSGRIKATDKWALPTQTEPLIQQNMSPPYRYFSYFAFFSAGGGQAAPT